MGRNLVDALSAEDKMREVLIKYLLAKVEECDWHAVSDAANDLRVLEAREQTSEMNEPAPTPNLSHPQDAVAYGGGEMKVEWEPIAPGEYRLKRKFIGPIGARLDECKAETLKKNIALFYVEGRPLHPDVALDVAAAEKYLETLK
jgi:hypothetical protein